MGDDGHTGACLRYYWQHPLMTEFIITLKQDAIICARLTQHLMVGMEEVAHSQSALLSWLNYYDVKRVKIILDLSEEELYVERHPSLFPWEVKSYAERQQHRRFPSTPYTRYLYTQSPKLPWQSFSGELWQSGFNDHDIIEKLLSWLNNAEVMVESLHSSMSILKTMMLKTWFAGRVQLKNFQQQAMVLLVRVAEQDFRQLLIVDGHIRTNRQIHVDAKELPEQMRLLIQEVNLLDKFAKTQKLITQEVRLQLFYVAREAEDKQQAIQVFQKSPFAEFSPTSHFADMQSLIADVHLHQLYERLLALTLSSARLTSDYRPKIVQQVQAVRQGAFALWLLWAASLLFLIGYGFSYITNEYETKQSIEKLVQLKEEQQDYIARYMTYNDLDLLRTYSVEDIKQVVDGVDKIQEIQQQQLLMPFWQPLSRVLSDYPDVTLMRMSFAKPIIRNGTKEIQVIDSSIKQVNLSFILHASSQLKLVEMLGQIDRFIVALQTIEPNRIKKVTMIQKPLDLDSSKALKLNLDDKSDLDRIPLPFELLVEIGYE